nr:reverse transcriptase domain-containing protein [Tanacetum cinerariifolium]
MTDNPMMEEMLQAPTEGYGDAIMVPDILAKFFEIKTSILSLIQANQFHGFESNNPHDHIRSFNRITLTLKFRDVPNDAIKLMLFPYSLEGAAKIWIDKLTDTISNLVETFNKKMTTPATVKAVEETCVICGGAHPHYDCIATDRNISSACATTGYIRQGEAQKFLGFLRGRFLIDDLVSLSGFFSNIEQNQGSTNAFAFSHFSFIHFLGSC